MADGQGQGQELIEKIAMIVNDPERFEQIVSELAEVMAPPDIGGLLRQQAQAQTQALQGAQGAIAPGVPGAPLAPAQTSQLLPQGFPAVPQAPSNINIPPLGASALGR